jgi:hypothetical protein
VELDQGTQEALRAIDCLKEGRLDRKPYARALAAELESSHVAHGLGEVVTAQISAGQLVSDVVGVSDDQLVEVTKPMLSASARGLVQRALSNGTMLCANRVRSTVVVQGDSRTLSVATRFLSDDSATIEQYVFGRSQRRTDLLIAETKAQVELVKTRLPAMISVCNSFLEELNQSWQRALTPGTQP